MNTESQSIIPRLYGSCLNFREHKPSKDEEGFAKTILPTVVFVNNAKAINPFPKRAGRQATSGSAQLNDMGNDENQGNKP